LDQIIHVKGTYHHLASNLGSNPQYQHLRETERLAPGCWEQRVCNLTLALTCGMIWTLERFGLVNYNYVMIDLWIGLLVMVYIMLLRLWMHICIYVVVIFEFEIYMYTCCRGQIWIIYLIFFVRKSTVGVVLDWTTPTNRNYRGGWF
jgi:hypothetical protein